MKNTLQLLWSFEGASAFDAAPTHSLGGHSDGDTPLPIPNREVKPVSADGTRRAISRESRTPPTFLKARSRGPGQGPFVVRKSPERDGDPDVHLIAATDAGARDRSVRPAVAPGSARATTPRSEIVPRDPLPDIVVVSVPCVRSQPWAKASVCAIRETTVTRAPASRFAASRTHSVDVPTCRPGPDRTS